MWYLVENNFFLRDSVLLFLGISFSKMYKFASKILSLSNIFLLNLPRLVIIIIILRSRRIVETVSRMQLIKRRIQVPFHEVQFLACCKIQCVINLSKSVTMHCTFSTFPGTRVSVFFCFSVPWSCIFYFYSNLRESCLINIARTITYALRSFVLQFSSRLSFLQSFFFFAKFRLHFAFPR